MPIQTQFPTTFISNQGELLKNLAFAYNFNDLPSLQKDAVGPNDITWIGDLHTTPGKHGLAIRLNGETRPYVQNATTAVSHGSGSFTVVAWVKLAAKSSTHTVAARWIGTNEWALDYNHANRAFRFYVQNPANATKILVESSFGEPDINTWCFVVAGYDANSDELFISINNNSVSTLSNIGGMKTSASTSFHIGNRGSNNNIWQGDMDFLAGWHRKLTQHEIQVLYNNGNGIEYPFTSPVGPATPDNSRINPLVGAYTWYNDTRALASDSGDKYWVGWVDNHGNIKIGTYDLLASEWSVAIVKIGLQLDDHCNPAILRRASDGRLMAWYSQHNGRIYQRLSSNTDDATSWGAETDLTAPLSLGGYSYANPFQLTGETDSPIYLFSRAWQTSSLDWAQYYSKSLNEGSTWSPAIRWLGDGSQRPYLKAVQNGDLRIDFLISDGHPNEVSTNSLYHLYYEGGNLHRSNGELVGPLDEGPYQPSDFTKIYDGTSIRAWNHDIALDGEGNIVVVYATFPSTNDHRYHYGRWDGTNWISTEICSAGSALYSSERYYSGGVTIDHSNTNVVYASRDTGNGIHQIWKYETADSGATWGGAQLTNESVRCLRPFVVRGATNNPKLCFFKGEYRSYTNYDTEITLIDG